MENYYNLILKHLTDNTQLPADKSYRRPSINIFGKWMYVKSAQSMFKSAEESTYSGAMQLVCEIRLVSADPAGYFTPSDRADLAEEIVLCGPAHSDIFKSIYTNLAMESF